MTEAAIMLSIVCGIYNIQNVLELRLSCFQTPLRRQMSAYVHNYQFTEDRNKINSKS
jgi:hypothetical protein